MTHCGRGLNTSVDRFPICNLAQCKKKKDEMVIKWVSQDGY